MDRFFPQVSGFLSAYGLQLSRGNHAKKMTMIRRYTLLRCVIAMSLLADIISPDVRADTVPGLIVYVGPQSVSPREIIHVTVEVSDRRKNNIHDGKINLSYVSDGSIKTLSGTPRHGLVSFEVPAQDTAGLMKFSANTQGERSKDALVTVTAAQPQAFSLEIEAGEHAETLKLTSDVITDYYGNPVSDLSLVTIDWIEEKGLGGRQSVQLFKGRIILTTPCPDNFTTPLKIRAAVNTIDYISNDVSFYCDAGQG